VWGPAAGLGLNTDGYGVLFLYPGRRRRKHTICDLFVTYLVIACHCYLNKAHKLFFCPRWQFSESWPLLLGGASTWKLGEVVRWRPHLLERCTLSFPVLTIPWSPIQVQYAISSMFRLVFLLLGTMLTKDGQICEWQVGSVCGICFFLFMCDLCLCVCESSMMFRSESKVFRSSVAGNAMAAEINAAT